MWASAAGLTPSFGYRWPSDVDGELGVSVERGPAPPHPDMRLLWLVWAALPVGLVLLVLDVTGWPMVAVLAGAGILTARATVRLEVAKARVRRHWHGRPR